MAAVPNVAATHRRTNTTPTMQRGTTWCNDCNGTCATDGCTASCAVADLPEYFTLLAYFAAGALAFAAVALLALRIRAASSSKKRT